jgi:hypothetical protein
MIRLIVLLILIVMVSCKTQEPVVNPKHFTMEWYEYNGHPHHVFKTEKGVKYIVILEKKRKRLIRQKI